MTLAKHPESREASPFEPTIGEQLRLDGFLASARDMSRDDLLEAVQLLAHHFFVTHPASVRFLAKEAARNLMGS